MALDATEVRVGVTGHLYAAPVGTAYPADASTTPAGAWIELGYVTEDGLAVSSNTDTTDIMAWQSFFPVRRVRTSQMFEVAFKLMQMNAATLHLVFGGGVITTAGTGTKFTPPAAGVIDERSFMFEVIDGIIIDRWCLDRGFATLNGDIVFKKDEATVFDLTVAAIAAAGSTTPWSLLTNNADVPVGA